MVCSWDAAGGLEQVPCVVGFTNTQRSAEKVHGLADGCGCGLLTWTLCLLV
jgi:hypothetical protein